MRFLQNLAFWSLSESDIISPNLYKTPEMNVSDIELSKKSKIIEIGSEKKKLQPLKVGDISKKSENLKIFVNEIQIFLQKLSQILKNIWFLKKFIFLISFSFDVLVIIFGILHLYRICNTQKIRIFDFSIFSMILDRCCAEIYWKIMRFVFYMLYIM